MPLSPQGRSHTSPEQIGAILAARAADPDATCHAIAQATGSSRETVGRLLTRFAPVEQHLTSLQREPLLAAYQAVAMRAVSRADELLEREHERGLGKEIQQVTLASAIALDKALLLAGQPTTIAYVAHAHRVILPDLVERIAAARAIQGHEAAPEPQVLDVLQDGGRVNGD